MHLIRFIIVNRYNIYKYLLVIILSTNIDDNNNIMSTRVDNINKNMDQHKISMDIMVWVCNAQKSYFKAVMKWEPRGKGPQGQSKERWLRRFLEIIGEHYWRNLIQDLENWRK